ncbi:uncharacterized protein MAM_03902 [Metarhizium album ARSEF 1941]|uniref:Uncharacterized protein n=1 Tax=Metarhizium album (strain ARSEF 1941) TaxID=1081103 RepID=A0A0B2WQ24_METAS|nr:uncharacterized protein MAM_03902 [Metarhizium album ARSEF 1941]KHN98141.1 hypothetical protein MAM_03902 [Metarhizium album ARSEF 1941]
MASGNSRSSSPPPLDSIPDKPEQHKTLALGAASLDGNLETSRSPVDAFPLKKTTCGPGPNHERAGNYSDAVLAVNENYLHLMEFAGKVIVKHLRPGCWSVLSKGSTHIWVCNHNDDDVNVRQEIILEATIQLINQCRKGDATLGQALAAENWQDPLVLDTVFKLAFTPAG